MPTTLNLICLRISRVLGVAVMLLGISVVAADEPNAEGRILPAAPIAFEPVYLVLPKPVFDFSCRHYLTFKYRVEMSNNTLSVHADSSMVPRAVVCHEYWVTLGSFPVGEYTVQLYLDGAEIVDHTYAFTVTDPGFGEWAAPVHNFSGFYWDPLESGSSLQVIQTGKESLAAVLLTYDSQGVQQWIVIGAGHWERPGRYVGKAWNTRNGWPISEGQPTQPIQAEAEVLGDTVLDFSGGGLGSDILSARVQITTTNGDVLRRDYQRFEF